MTGVAALYYDGHTARAVPVELTADGTELHVRASSSDGELVRTVPSADVQITSRLAAIRRVIRLPDGAQIHCDDNDAIDALFPQYAGSTVVDRLERHPAAIAASILVGAFAIAWFFFIGLPQIAERIAREIPPAAEALIGTQTLALLDRTALQPSTVPPERQQELTDVFGRFAAGMPGAARYTLEFRKLPGNLPNAFAIPGGAIIVSDGLVDALPDESAFLAVVAHEIGHQVHHHVLRSVLQGSAVIVVATLLTGDVSSATGVMLAVPTFLLSSRYSRDFEREADAFAFAALRDRDISPEWFAHALRTISDRAPVQDSDVSSYVSTHPASEDRLNDALEAAHGFEALEVIVAKETAATTGHGTAFDTVHIAGCWGGTLQTDANRYSQWEVSFSEDGAVNANFYVLDEARTVLRASTETGRWALHDDVLAVRLLTSDAGAGARRIDDLQTYVIDDLTNEIFDYESVRRGTYYESTRIDCAKFEFTPGR